MNEDFWFHYGCLPIKRERDDVRSNQYIKRILFIATMTVVQLTQTVTIEAQTPYAIKNGITAPMVFVDETGTVNFALTHGNNRIYNIFPVTYTEGLLCVGAGIRVRWMPGNWILSVDIISSGYYMHDGKDYFIRNSIRCSAGYTIFDRINIFAGISDSYMVQITKGTSETEMPIKPLGGYYNTKTHN